MMQTHSGQQRHRQHRRQMSTPSALEAANVPNLPAPAMRRFQAHRRGQSLDQRMVHAQPPMPVQDGAFSATNATIQHPHAFAQQGNAPFPHNSSSIPLFSPESLTQDDLDAIASLNGGHDSSSVTYVGPNVILFGTKGLEGQPLNINLRSIQQHQVQISNPTCGNAPRQVLNNNSWDAHQQANFAAFPPQPNGLHGGGMRRLSVQSDTSGQSQMPHTPTTQRVTYYHPITPETTPFNRSANTTTYQDVQSTPTKPHRLSSVPCTMDASYMQRARSLQGVVGTTYTQPKFEMISPPNTASLKNDSKDVFDCKQGSSFENPVSQSISYHHYTSSSSSSASSFYSAPELADMPSPGVSNGKNPKVPICPVVPSRKSPQQASDAASATPPATAKLSPRVASIENLNLDSRVHASITQTGVTTDEIESYISGPDPADKMWVCLHEECGRRFGRKENIKSHVQTHLGDRQYKCEDCGKCFVRGHDLKRHAKIHTGDKPYACSCGNRFARHDALTRHRQRGMCDGGFTNVVRKVVKRGRPKKHRPEMDERQEKAARTRQRVAEQSATQSVTDSDTSHNSPAAEFFETMSARGHSPAVVFNNPNYSLPPDVLSSTSPSSPGHAAGASTQTPYQANRSPSAEDGMLPVSPSQRVLERIEEETELPFISDSDAYQYTDVANSVANPLSSPYTAPTLTDSTAGSDLDMFASLDSDMAPFPSYESSSFDDGMDLFPVKNFRPTLTGEMLQYPNDGLPSEVMSKDFFLD